MEYPHKIILYLQKRLYNQHVTTPKRFFTELYAEHLRWVAEFWAMEPPLDDEGNPQRDLPWIEVFNSFEEYYKRVDVSAITVSYVSNPDEQEFWKLTIGVPGAWLKAYFKERDKAEEAQKILLAWWLR